MTGLKVSLRHLFQNSIIQGDIGYQLLQPDILPLQCLEPFCLLYSHTTILFAPPVVGLFGDSDLPAGLADVSSLIQQDLSFAQLVDNLLRRMRFLDNDLPPLFLVPV